VFDFESQTLRKDTNEWDIATKDENYVAKCFAIERVIAAVHGARTIRGTRLYGVKRVNEWISLTKRTSVMVSGPKITRFSNMKFSASEK
jgi:hypothetical protein